MSKPNKSLPNKSVPVKEVDNKPVKVTVGIGFNSGVRPLAQEPRSSAVKPESAHPRQEQDFSKHTQDLSGQESTSSVSEAERRLHHEQSQSEHVQDLPKHDSTAFKYKTKPKAASTHSAPESPPTKSTPSKGAQIRTRVLLWMRDIGIAILVAILIMQFVRPTIVQQHSMEDTLHENDYVFLNRQAYNFGEIKHGDIFVFKHTPPIGSGDEEKNLIKRVVGLPGDEVSISGGNVYVNGKVIDDSYTKDGYTDGQMDPMLIPDNYIFALGDNRQNSFDSRDPMLGLIDMRDVIGKAVFRVFPVNNAGFIN